MRLW